MAARLSFRSLALFIVVLVSASLIIPLHKSSANPTSITFTQSQSQAKVDYVCPPCGLQCDTLTFDKPGNCPNCGMKLVERGGHGEVTVAILLFNGAEIIDYAGPWEVFGTAGFLVHTVAEKIETLTAVFGQKMIPDFNFENCPRADILLVPGGGVSEAMENPRLIQFIQATAKQSSHVISVCTGAFLLGKAGLLAEQAATTVDGMTEDLRKFPNVKIVTGQRYVDNGKIITTAGLSSGIDGALHLVSKILGKGEAQSAALNIEYRWDPDSRFSRAALADRFLPDGLKFGKAGLKGATAKLISTDGDADRWEIKLIVSDPKSSAEIMDLLRKRIAANTSYIRGAVRFSPRSANAFEVRWKFTDDVGRGWSGRGDIGPLPADSTKFVVTLEVAHSKG
jgi:putative intracellular protease/amidase/DNA-directed RNA polymerase subunit RPC12/RpoP